MTQAWTGERSRLKQVLNARSKAPDLRAQADSGVGTYYIETVCIVPRLALMLRMQLVSGGVAGAVLATCAGVSIALVAAGSASATFPGRNGLIAFQSDRHPLLNHPQVFSLAIRGGKRRNLSASLADDLDPSPSPDGRQIAFSRHGDLWLMNANGSSQRLLARGASRPVWSPNGKTLAFNGDGPGDCPPGAFRCGRLVAVWTVRRDGSGLRRFGPTTRNASWSPSGRWLAYEGAIDPYGDAHGVRVARADGSHARWVARAGGQPAWAPNGRLIAYSGDHGVELVRPDGTGRRRLDRSGRSPSWASPRRSTLVRVWAAGRLSVYRDDLCAVRQ